MAQDTRTRPHVVNPDDRPKDPPQPKGASHWKMIAGTAALTTLVGAAVLGATSFVWKAATKRATRLMRRQQQAEQLEPSPYAYPPSPVYPAAQATTMAYAWPQPNARDIPDALREGPRLSNTAPPPQQQPIVVAPSPEIVAEIRRLGAHVDKRFAALDKRMDAIDNPAFDEDDEDDDEEEPPRRRN